MKYEALRKEIDNMLSVLPGDWSVETIPHGASSRFTVIVVSQDANAVTIMLSGKGRTKAEALERLLENWRRGDSEPYAPAAGSAEELRLKMAVLKG